MRINSIKPDLAEKWEIFISVYNEMVVMKKKWMLYVLLLKIKLVKLTSF